MPTEVGGPGRMPTDVGGPGRMPTDVGGPGRMPSEVGGPESRRSRTVTVLTMASATAPVRAWIDLTKIRLNALVVFAVAASFYVASPGPVDWLRLMNTLLGAGLVAMGSSALNMVLELPYDSMMARTRDRPLPAGVVSARAAATF